MPVIDPNAGIHYGLGAVKEELQKLNAKVDKLIPSESSSDVKEERNGTFVLRAKSNLVWWSKVDTAARYRLILVINLDEVCTLDLDRETRYHVFEQLPKGIYYTVRVIAEDRDGKEIVSASIGL